MLHESLIIENIWIKSFVCLITSYVLSHIGIKFFLEYINDKQIMRQPIRKDGPKSHLKNKKNTPTMGGIFIVLATTVTSLLFLNLNNPYLFVTLLVFLLFAVIGVIDDLFKVVYKNPDGFRGSAKVIIQSTIIAAVILWLGFNNTSYFSGRIFLPLSKAPYIFVGLALYTLFVTFVVVGSANAVNLTDGLDGLVSVPVMINLVCLIILIFMGSDAVITKQFKAPYVANTRELMFFCFALMGAVAAFLTFNFKPAKIFMGDVGSLSIGAVLGLIAIIMKEEFIFFIISLVFVAEAISVILQVGSYKIRKKRIFLMAPLHHHFEKKGMKEQQVVSMFWHASLSLAAIGMMFYFI